MPKIVKIGLIQTKVTKDLKHNINHAKKMVEDAAKKGAKIICLPELYKTPYFPQEQGVDTSTFWERTKGESFEKFAPLAKKYKACIILPIFEQAANGKFYNSVVVVDDMGKILPTYRKLHIPHDPGFYEKDYFENGDQGYKVYKTKFGTFAVLICFDQWFPEAARMARLAGAQIIFYPTAIGDVIGYEHPNDWHDAWETIQRGHAIANSVVVATVNRTGREGQTQFWGQSFVSDAWGKILKRAPKNSESVVVQDVDLEYNEFLSEGWGFMRNRRVDTYILHTDKLVEKSKKLKNVAHYKQMQAALKKSKQ